MKVDITSMFFNSSIEGQTATPAWRTSIGQSKSKECRIETDVQGVTDIVIGMTYKMLGDTSKLNVSNVSGELLMCSVFNKVFINNDLLEDTSYILLLLREDSVSHNGRMQVCYSPRLSIGDIKNADTIEKMRAHIGCAPSGCWFVYDISVKNQDELHFSSVIVDKDKPTLYTTKSQDRSKLWKSLVPNTITKTTGLSDDTSYLPYLTALRTKPFMLLAGISGTGKSRIVRELAFKSCPSYLQDEDGTTPGNYCMIEVKPNWHDSSELLGYYSNIAKQYVFTDFVKFLLKAKLYNDVPFFVCMDEMNLAPVEQYFAEFLSVLETRKQTESGIKTGALVKGHYFKRIKSVNEYDNVQTDADVYTLLEISITAEQKEELAKTNSLKTEGLTLPENVFVIGTVNMDDTTHQFSRKVLDRAMTIEMNGGELKDMFGHSSDLEYLPEENVWKIDQFKPKHVNADEVLEEHIDSNGDLDETGIALKTQLADKLDAINNVLKDTPFVVSYRVLNELVIYAGVLLDDGREIDEAINEAVDRITLMKILPRIEGDEDLLGNAKDENNRLCQLMKVVGPKSQAKIKEMNRRLESGFTRFWP